MKTTSQTIRSAILCGVLFGSGWLLAAGDGRPSQNEADKNNTDKSASVPPTRRPIDYIRDVRPILSNNCFACHGPDEKTRKGGLRLDVRDEALAVLSPGRPTESELLRRVCSTDKDEVMPPAKTGRRLTPAEVDILRRWIAQEAPYAPHWAYHRPNMPPLPQVQAPAHFPIRNPIDAFIVYRLQQEGLSPQPEADRFTLARRVCLDLTGLPPTLEEVDAFVRDPAPDAYERYVDRVLAKPTFGEHWARFWLDLARYADSAGYADDPPRTIWKYRDYVIASFNANKPFDRFTLEQLAGDLLLEEEGYVPQGQPLNLDEAWRLPPPALDMLIATAFHRNTMTNNEGGTSDEEFRNVAVVDRVNTTFTVWMATSVGCAQCHSHKYDPISQKEYFQVFAIFNNTADADRPDESPVLPLWTEQLWQKKQNLQREIQHLEQLLRGKKPEEATSERQRLEALKKQLAAIRPVTTVPILQELRGAQRRTTRIQHRGNFQDLGEVVTEGTPAIFHPFPAHWPKNRLGFARWLMSPENPLTARVIANRFWEQIFGVGIVRTSEEFGTQGELPSHPELLDWLALELQKDWNIKRFLKLLVTSSAYRQSARVTAELFERDPDNRLLGRGPRVRLTAEMVRDQALFAAGLLSSKMFGPSVKPPQPNLGLTAAFGSRIDWETSSGEDRYRRGLYTTWRRSNPYPSMVMFDAPNREVCTVRRSQTNTPLQALVTLNDPVYVEAAQALARLTLQHGGASPESRAAWMFRRCLIRPPSTNEVQRLVALYRQVREQYATNPAQAQRLATDPLGPLPPGIDPVEAAAWTAVGNIVLNLDEIFLKR
jgi:mono/diheme cytochrome c family protein